ncbi:MAG: hypothetical protein ABI673_09595 [Novosphingobium sp.]
MNETPLQRAKSLFSGSIGFYEAARALNQVTGELHWPAFTVLMSYAAELSIKAFIIHKSPAADDNMLREIGHKLNSGLTMAIELGYTPPNWVTADLFNMLNDHHVNHYARYLSGPPVVMKPHAIMLAAMADHLTSIGAQISIPISLQSPAR